MARNITTISDYDILSQDRGLRFYSANTKDYAMSTVARDLLAEGWEEVTDPERFKGWRTDYVGCRIFTVRSAYCDRMIRIHPVQVNGRPTGNRKF